MKTLKKAKKKTITDGAWRKRLQKQRRETNRAQAAVGDLERERAGLTEMLRREAFRAGQLTRKLRQTEEELSDIARAVNNIFRARRNMKTPAPETLEMAIVSAAASIAEYNIGRFDEQRIPVDQNPYEGER